jgi:glutathione S-transferase
MAPPRHASWSRANTGGHTGVIYQLYYWPGIQGRGEYIRLALEESGAAYVDCALVPAEKGGGERAIERLLADERIERPPFAVPCLKAGRQLIGQTANILLFLGGRLHLAPRDAAGKLWTHQLQLTIADFLVEIHDTHHPIGGGLYYEQQQPAARRRSRQFLQQRLPKFLDYFERVLARNSSRGPWLVGSRLTYVDLSMAQVIAGLRYAFPSATGRALQSRPRVRALQQAAFARPRIRRYLASERRLAFNNDDLFRHYPELDLAR